MKTVSKELTVSLEYLEGKDRPQNGYFEGGIKDPEYTEELMVWVEEEELYDDAKKCFGKSGRLQVNIGGSERSLFELGRYLIALSLYKTANMNYHDHIEEPDCLEGKKSCELVLHHPKRFSLS